MNRDTGPIKFDNQFDFDSIEGQQKVKIRGELQRMPKQLKQSESRFDLDDEIINHHIDPVNQHISEAFDEQELTVDESRGRN